MGSESVTFVICICFKYILFDKTNSKAMINRCCVVIIEPQIQHTSQHTKVAVRTHNSLLFLYFTNIQS